MREHLPGVPPGEYFGKHNNSRFSENLPESAQQRRVYFVLYDSKLFIGVLIKLWALYTWYVYNGCKILRSHI